MEIETGPGWVWVGLGRGLGEKPTAAVAVVVVVGRLPTRAEPHERRVPRLRHFHEFILPFVELGR
jgi:hypothetical protein